MAGMMGDHGKGSLPPLNVSHMGGGGRMAHEAVEGHPHSTHNHGSMDGNLAGPRGLTLPVVSVNVRQPDFDHPTAPMGPSSSTSTNMVAPPSHNAQTSGIGKRFNRPLRIEVTPPKEDPSVMPAANPTNNGPGSINITVNSTTGGGNQPPQRRPQGSEYLAPIDTTTAPAQPAGTGMRRVSSTPAGLYSTSLAKRERPKVSRGVLRVDVPPEVSAKIHEILGDTCDTGELLHNTICNVDPMLSRTMRQSTTTSSFSSDSPVHAPPPMSASLINCWDAVFDARPYQRVVAIKDSLARVYVLTIAKHLVSSLLKVKQNQEYVKQLRRNEHDIKQLAGLLNKHMESLTVFTSVSPGTKEVLTDQDRGFLGSMPAPAHVCMLMSQLPFLSRCFVELSRASLSFLAACDNVVRETLLDNATSGRYFFSQSLLRKDLEGAVSYFNTQEVYLEYFGHLSHEPLVEGCLPYIPLSKPELYSLISVGTSRYKATSSSASRSMSPQFASLATSSDQEMLDVMVEVLFADDPFRCSPFMVTFGERGTDTRPAYKSMTIATSTTTTTASTFPQIYLSLSRQLYYSRMTKEGLDDFLKKHFELSGDYLTCADLPALIDMAMGLASTGVDTVFTGKRMFGEYTTNMYADMMVAKFISNFYHDCLRKMQTQPTDGGPLAFSQQFSMTNRPTNMLELEQVLHLSGTGDTAAGLSETQPMGALGGPSETLRHSLGATLQFSEGKDQMYILAVTERLMGGLKLAQHAMDRSRISSCEMVQAMLVWYTVWAQGSISRCVSTGKNMDTVKRRSTFESLRRICALCADLNCVARFCDEVIERIRPEEMFASQSRTPNSRGGNSSSQVFFGSMSLGMSFHGGSSTTPRRGYNQSTPTGMSKRAVTPTSTRRSHTPRNASMILGPKRTQHNESFAGAAPQQSDITDITGYDVIVLHLSSIADDLKLLSAQCLEQAIELGTRIAGHICKEHITKKHGDKARPFFPGGRRSSHTQKTASPSSKRADGPPSPDHTDTSTRPSAPAAGGEGRRGPNTGGVVELELPSSPRPWATEIELQLFKPLSDFCKSDMFSSETILPRILESCLHEALERVGIEYQYKVTATDARALHADFMYLKDWMEKEQKNQFPKCNLTELRVFDRLHVTISVLELPPDLSSWSKVDLASLYLLPDAPRWVKTRADRGKVPFSTVRRANSREEVAPVIAPPCMRMSLNINDHTLEDIVRLLAADEPHEAPVRLSNSGRLPSA